MYTLTVHYTILGAQLNGDVRLVGGPNSMTGRVEVYYGGDWLTIFYDANTDPSNCPGKSDKRGTAQTICRQLGFADETTFGTVLGLARLGYVNCLGGHVIT